MKGIELCEKFYVEHGAQMIHDTFPELEGIIAVGIAGSGSECFGYDDEISTDHDFEPGFCMFVSDNVIDSRTEFALERAYAKLPKEFLGYKRSKLSPVGGNRHGLIKMSEFFKDKVGNEQGMLSNMDWFFVPEQSLAEATNGKIFRDDLGALTKIREELAYLPSDIRLKKLAGNLLIIAQAGQYNYPRSIKRGDTASAQLAVIEMVKATLNVIFLLNKRYVPYYKWTFRALSELQILSELSTPLEYLISSGNDSLSASKKEELIENICSRIIDELRLQELTTYCGLDIEGHAYSVNNHIADGAIRNLHIMYAV